MTRLPSIFAFGLASVLLAGTIPLAAQETGSLVRSAPGEIPDGPDADANVRQGMYSFVTCVMGRSRNAVKAYLHTASGSAAAYQRAKRLATDECIVDGIEFDETVFRGAAFEMLYREEFGSKPVEDFALLPTVDYVVGYDLTSESQQQALALRRFADCVSRAAPLQVNALIMSRPGSSTENSAFMGLAPKFSGCLIKDVTLRFTKLALRGVLGETIYRIRSTSREGG